MSKPNQNQDIKNPNKGAGQNKNQAPKPGNRGEQMNPNKEDAGKKK
jgi:hypothetical protein